MAKTASKNTTHTKINIPSLKGGNALCVDNRHDRISPRLRAILSVVWDLNDQEKSYLDKHFMLIREPEDLINYHIDDKHLGDTLLNADIKYQVSFQGIMDWSEAIQLPKLAASFRYNIMNKRAIVIIKPWGEKK